MNRFAGFMGLFGRACAASTSGTQDCNQETVRTTVLYMNNSTYVCSIRRADSALEAGRGPLPSPTYANCRRIVRRTGRGARAAGTSAEAGGRDAERAWKSGGSAHG